MNRSRLVTVGVVILLVGTGLVAAKFRQPAEWCPPLEFAHCLLLVPGGTYVVGAQSTDPQGVAYDPFAEPDEAPPHRVKLSAYYLDQNEVTTRAFEACVEAGACRSSDVERGAGYFTFGRPERRDFPINGVTWAGASRFCEWIGGRLPTEAEWEVAARGKELLRYSWGNEPLACNDDARSGFAEGCRTDGPTHIGRYVLRSPFEMLGMSGSVWEWVSDYYAEDAYAKSPAENPRGPEVGSTRVQRGGSWDGDDPIERRAAYRASLDPTSKLADVGFRCARTAPAGWAMPRMRWEPPF